ncbi:hypothetical protein [Leisingera sp. ANG-S5]|uniref:hypothetical protein n=1 Tax=Leisingera sp. ANG-S5 TaxID=1577901 RepID=UPI0019D32BA0|nr:hypothetical protein [Leisingera sp. ANG-S5]
MTRETIDFTSLFHWGRKARPLCRLEQCNSIPAAGIGPVKVALSLTWLKVESYKNLQNSQTACLTGEGLHWVGNLIKSCRINWQQLSMSISKQPLL